MKKTKILLLSLTVSLALFLGIFFCHGFDGFRFHRMTDTFFSQSLENDALSLHFTLASPEAFGISLKKAALPVYSGLSSQQSENAAQNFLYRLEQIDPKRLKKEDRYTYDLLFSYLQQDLNGQKFLYYEEPLSPSSGMQSELPLLFAEYTFRTKEDVDTYLSLLQSTGPYLQGLTDYETEKSRAGFFMTAEDAENVAAQCSSIMDAGALSSGTHFLQATFRTRLDRLCQEKVITKQERTDYLAQNDRLLSSVVLPAYEKLANDMLLLSGTGRYDGGLCEKPDGRDYYAWLVKRTTGSTQDMDGIYVLLQKSFQKKYEELKSLLEKYRTMTGNPPDFTMLVNSFPLSDPSAILTDLQKRMREDFPPLSALSSDKINCTIKDVDTALEQYTSPAFYMTPPIDDLNHNTICINRSSTSEGIELYTTLAHEGYPGHLYQTVYSSLYASNQKEQPVREVLFYGGYVEGWAYYTEHLSYDYAAQLLSGADSETAASLLCSLASTQRDLQINLFSLLDVSLHYYGATREDILRSLDSFGLAGETAQRVYDYIRTSPAAYLKYYVGYLEMTALRERAKAQWGKDFTPLKFHTFVLEAGPSDFTNLTERLRSTT